MSDNDYSPERVERVNKFCFVYEEELRRAQRMHPERYSDLAKNVPRFMKILRLDLLQGGPMPLPGIALRATMKRLELKVPEFDIDSPVNVSTYVLKGYDKAIKAFLGA
jgi:hypothetical protein